MNEFSFDVTGLKEQTFEKGEHVLEEGKDSQNVFILKDGNVSVTADMAMSCAKPTRPVRYSVRSPCCSTAIIPPR